MGSGFEVEIQREQDGGGLATEDMTLSMGPQHPSTHGVLRFVVRADGEVMKEAIPDIGFLHRSIEKIAEKTGWHGFLPYTDRVDYVCAMPCNQGWCMVAEKLGNIEVPKRGEYCRVLAVELNRISSHLISVGSMAMDIGAFTPFLHAVREREWINDLLEELCGARLTYHYMRIGGVAWDVPPGWTEKALAFVENFEPMIDEYNKLISYNKIYTERLANVAVITAADAISYNLAGPNLRGSGISFDLRKDEPYSVYREFDFDVPVGRGEMGTLGDCFDRYMVRMREMKESCRILRQAIQQLPKGPVLAKVARNFKPPAGDTYVRVESARGDMGWYGVSDGTAFPYRCKIRTGSFSAISMIQQLSRNLMIADLIAVIASLDLVAPEIDR